MTLNLSIMLSKYDRISYQGREFVIPSIGLCWLLESWEQLVPPDNIEKSDAEKIKEVWGKLFNTLYRGFLNSNTNYLFDKPKSSNESIVYFSKFLESLGKEDCYSDDRCSFCLSSSNFSYKNFFTSEHFRELGASSSEKGLPNSFWNLSSERSLRICDFCSFVLLNSHLAFTPLSDGSEIFINAPSFRVMYYLNKFAREVMGGMGLTQARQKGDILAMSVMEYALRIQTTLGVWAGMNIELISRQGGEIEFFSLPYEVTGLLSDRRIAGILTQIGELSILNLVLKQDYARLIEIAYHLLRIGTKPYAERKKTENDFIRKTLYLERNRANVVRVCQNIISLYALIQEKRRNL